nr:nucleotide sugar dehydrogenase [Candidatus Gracilibacteria bacterium]
MFKNFNAKIAIIGLGYVGLPLAHAFVKEGFDVLGFDINQKRLEELKNKIDSTNEITGDEKEFLDKIKYSSNSDDLNQYNFFIITVPTPVNIYKKPDLTPVIKATETVAKNLKPGSIIVYESTVYPGVTEEVCLPIFEKISGLSFNTDFKLGYSPERINPGDKEHTVTKILKIVSGSDNDALEIISNIYGKIIKAGIFKASSIKVAEAAKVIENTQRDVNIALINELSLIFNKIGINTFDVLEAAGTKWNFLKFTPGLVGGHCIGVDPYYLVQKSEELGYYPEMISSARRINEGMGVFISNQIAKQLIKTGNKVEGANILVLGLTFKENVPDFRNSKIGDAIKELKDFGIKISGYDPYSYNLNKHILSEINLKEDEIISNYKNTKFDGVILAVNHKEFDTIDFNELLKDNGIIFDIKGNLRKKGYKNYKSL